MAATFPHTGNEPGVLSSLGCKETGGRHEPGVLLCSPSDGRATRHPRFMGDNFAVNLALVEKATELARQKGITPGQLALAWVHVSACLWYHLL